MDAASGTTARQQLTADGLQIQGSEPVNFYSVSWKKAGRWTS